MERPELTDEDLKEATEHRDAILDIRAMLSKNHGKRFFKFLFKHLDVGGTPELGLPDNLLHEKLGSLRTANSIYDMVAEADPNQAATLTAQNAKEHYAKLYEEFQNGQS